MTSRSDTLRDIRNTLVAQALLLKEALTQAQRTDEVDALRKAVDKMFSQHLEGLHLGPPAGWQPDPNMVEEAG